MLGVAGTRSKLLKLGNIEPLKLDGRDILIVTQYNYLGVILDAEMTLCTKSLSTILYNKTLV